MVVTVFLDAHEAELARRAAQGRPLSAYLADLAIADSSLAGPYPGAMVANSSRGAAERLSVTLPAHASAQLQRRVRGLPLAGYLRALLRDLDQHGADVTRLPSTHSRLPRRPAVLQRPAPMPPVERPRPSESTMQGRVIEHPHLARPDEVLQDLLDDPVPFFRRSPPVTAIPDLMEGVPTLHLERMRPGERRVYLLGVDSRTRQPLGLSEQQVTMNWEEFAGVVEAEVDAHDLHTCPTVWWLEDGTGVVMVEVWCAAGRQRVA